MFKSLDLYSDSCLSFCSFILESWYRTLAGLSFALGYDMVISKSMVIMGGDDITAEIQKIVK